jgi:hypothetical protein
MNIPLTLGPRRCTEASQILLRDTHVVPKMINIYIHTYHLRFTPEGVAGASQIFLRDAHVLPKLFSYA